jgi:hypothetical protein
MGFALSYCPNGAERLERLRALYTERPQDRVFAMIEVPSRALERFGERYPEGFTGRPGHAERVAFWDEYLAERQGVEDDSIPCAYLTEQDQGLYGGIVGGQLQYMAHPENGWISSMVPPVLKSWEEMEGLDTHAETDTWRYYVEQLEAFTEGAEGKWGISHFILIDALNFVFELFGATRAYLEVEDNPERVRAAIDFAYRLNVRVQQAFFDKVGLLEGGTCSNMAGWVPGRIVSESVDPFHMTSAGYFERWGREPVERILGTFDGGVVHLHGNGRHLLGAVKTVKGLKGLLLANDRGYARAITVLGELRRVAGDLPLVVDCTYDELVAAFEAGRVVGGCLYKVGRAPGVDEANRLMERVRGWRA